MNKNYDLIVIGSGPGGYVAAIRAAQLGLKTLVVEKDKLGGICLNWGCIPTKALLRSAEIRHLMSEINNYGLNMSSHKFDWNKVIKRSRNIADKLSEGIKFLLKKNKIDVIFGEGKLSGPGRVVINNGEEFLLEASNIILATGARPKTLKGLEIDNKNIWSYKDAMMPNKLPKSIIIVGAGAIGVEFASFYNDFDVDVTLVETQKNILPLEDSEVSDFIRLDFFNRKINILNETKIINLESKNTNVIADLEFSDGKRKKITYSKAIVAVGIEANVDSLGLDSINIKINNGHIITNEYGQTSEKGIYAIGDITGAPWLAHKASHEGINCVEYIANGSNSYHDLSIIPSCTYARPQVASIGMTEEKAKKLNKNLKIGKFSLVGNGKALAAGDNSGFVKTIFDKDTGELIGAHLVGPEVTELVSVYSLAMKLEATELDLMNTIFPHPTISESIHESVLDAYDRAIHI